MDDDVDERPTTTLDALQAEGWITSAIREIKSGKEATVYCCSGGPRTQLDLVAAKIYRSRMHRTFRNDAMYQEGRIYADMRPADRRARRAVEHKSRFGRAKQFASWIDHEFAMLSTLYEVGADVPQPLCHTASSILMEFIGDVQGAAPLLYLTSITADEAQILFDRVMHNIELFLQCNVVHGDLSSFNMLQWDSRLIIIDFPQAVDARFNPHSRDLLLRDISNVAEYFSRFGVRADPWRLTNVMWHRFLHAGF